MLMLQRLSNQSVRMTVPPSETETIVEVMMCRIKVWEGVKYSAVLGFTAPREVKILRKELCESIQREQGNDGAG